MSNDDNDFVREFNLEATGICSSCQRKVADTAFATFCVHCGWALRCVSCGGAMVSGRCVRQSHGPSVPAPGAFCGPTPWWLPGTGFRIDICPSGASPGGTLPKRLWTTRPASELLWELSPTPDGALLLLDEVSPRIVFEPGVGFRSEPEGPRKTYAVLCLECREEFSGGEATREDMEEAFRVFALHKANRHGSEEMAR